MGICDSNGAYRGIEAVTLSQKVYEHTPQGKVLELLVAILSGAKVNYKNRE